MARHFLRHVVPGIPFVDCGSAAHYIHRHIRTSPGKHADQNYINFPDILKGARMSGGGVDAIDPARQLSGDKLSKFLKVATA